MIYGYLLVMLSLVVVLVICGALLGNEETKVQKIAYEVGRFSVYVLFVVVAGFFIEFIIKPGL